MKKIMKWLYGTTIQLCNSVVSFFSVLFFSSFKTGKSFKQIKKEISNDDVCYIIANGPSLNSFLEKGNYPKKGLMVVNYFSLSPYFKKLKPDNYIVADQSMIGRANEEDINDVNNVYTEINSIDWKMNMFFPADVSPAIVNKISSNDNIRIIYYNRTPIDGFKSLRHFLYKHNLGMPRPQNITNAAVFCAINLGYKKIYLYGAEHSWLKSFECDPRNHKIYMNDGHFYEEENMRYFNRGEYCDWCLYIHMALVSHFMLREYADYCGAKVINKTPQSFVEAYEFNEY